MNDKNEDLKSRTKEFALRVIRLMEKLPPKPGAKVIGNQLLRSGTSIGANYRAACRARSPAEFRSRMAVVEEEADESCYWIELLAEAGIIKPERLSGLLVEAGALTAIAVSSIITSRRNQK